MKLRSHRFLHGKLYDEIRIDTSIVGSKVRLFSLRYIPETSDIKLMSQIIYRKACMDFWIW